MKKFLVAVITGALLATAVRPVQATTVADDFNYNNTAGGTGMDGCGYLGNPISGGTGWDGNWGATTGGAVTGALCTAPTDGSTITLINNHMVGPNLTNGSSGYNITQTGNGMAVTVAGASDWRGINRYIHTVPGSAGGLTGTIWFSFLIEVGSNQAFNAVQFNAHADIPYSGADYPRGDASSRLEVGITGDSQLRLTCGTIDVLGAAGALTVGQPHLIIGKLDVGTGTDTITVWADPADPTNLGPGLSGSVDIGNSLYLVGLGGYNYNANNAYAAYDALRISDGGGNPQAALADVTGIIMPASVVTEMALDSFSGTDDQKFAALENWVKSQVNNVYLILPNRVMTLNRSVTLNRNDGNGLDCVIEGNGGTINFNGSYGLVFGQSGTTGRIGIENLTLTATNTAYSDSALFIVNQAWQSYFNNFNINGNNNRHFGAMIYFLWGSHWRNSSITKCRVGVQIGTSNGPDNTHNTFDNVSFTYNKWVGLICSHAVGGGIFNSSASNNDGIGIAVVKGADASRSYSIQGCTIDNNCKGTGYSGVYPAVIFGRMVPNTEWSSSEAQVRHCKVANSYIRGAYQKGSIAANVFYGFDVWNNTCYQKSTSMYDVYFYGTKAALNVFGNSNPKTTFKVSQ